MTDYYCDLGDGTFADNVGTSTGAAYTGPAGLQAVIRGTGNATALDKGDTLYLKGTGDQSRLVLIDCNGTDVTAGGLGWAVGDAVESKDGGSAQWSGVIVETDDGGFLGASDMLLVWLASGKSASDVVAADGVTNTTQTESAAPLADNTSTPGIVVDNNAGDNDEPITLVGVDSLWAEDGTRAILDGNDKAAYNVCSASKGYFHCRNIHARDSVSHGWCASSGTNYWHWENCIAEGSGGDGWHGSGTGFKWSTMHRCKAFDWSGTYGFNAYITSLSHCTAYNGTTGFYNNFSQSSGCVAFQCTTGFVVDRGGSLYNCVADDNTTGVQGAYGELQMVGCRITNNTTGVGGSDVFHDPYTFYGGNTANWTADLGVDLVDGVSTRTISDAAADIGYIDSDNATLADRNYGLTNQAAARRQAVTL